MVRERDCGAKWFEPKPRAMAYAINKLYRSHTLAPHITQRCIKYDY